jgi:hypothetical protein
MKKLPIACLFCLAGSRKYLTHRTGPRNLFQPPEQSKRFRPGCWLGRGSVKIGSDIHLRVGGLLHG